ncbi:MAG: hypothetical protein JXL80_02330 [Planctomycetes bacterium]|nr:hypothetical protein [Planctomycetota bacterium]
MSVPKLNRSQFQDALTKGLGRAVAYVRVYGESGVREDILHACSHNLVYDPQCECDRLDYLLNLIALSSDVPHYERAICRALAETSDTWDALQLAALAGVFARRGSAEARRAVYNCFERTALDEAVGDQEIMLLEGLKGFLWMVSRHGSRLAADLEKRPTTTYYRPDLAWRASHLFSEQVVLQTLSAEATACAGARTYLDAVKRYWLRKERRSSEDRNIPTVDEVLRNVEDGKDPNWRFARHASDSEINTIFEYMLNETRLDQLVKLLRIFVKREVPRLDGRLFELAEHEEAIIRRLAMRALGKSDDLWVREFAFSLLKRCPQSAGEGAINMLFHTYQAGDHEVIERVLPVVFSAESRHTLSMDILALAESYQDPCLAQSLLWLYECGPSTNYRCRAVECMLKIDVAPQWLFQECLDDCNSETRELAAAGGRAE